MLKGWGAWLGLDNKTADSSVSVAEEGEQQQTAEQQQEEKIVQTQNEVNKQQAADPESDPRQERGLGGKKI